MIILDDKLTLDALAGTLSADDSMATTWSFHYRLLQALTDPGRWGALGGSVTPEARRAVTQAPDGFRVLDPRVVTGEAAEVAVRHGLNLLAAELVTSGLHYVRLQEARHQADYDHLTNISTANTLNDYRQAEVALDLLHDLSETQAGQLFCP